VGIRTCRFETPHMHFSFCTISAATPPFLPSSCKNAEAEALTVHSGSWIHEPGQNNGKAGERELALIIAVSTLGPDPGSAAMHHAGRGWGGD